jgi:hypothetical protein
LEINVAVAGGWWLLLRRHILGVLHEGNVRLRGLPVSLIEVDLACDFLRSGKADVGSLPCASMVTMSFHNFP